MTIAELQRIETHARLMLMTMTDGSVRRVLVGAVGNKNGEETIEVAELDGGRAELLLRDVWSLALAPVDSG